jgi:hypothetical protein
VGGVSRARAVTLTASGKVAMSELTPLRPKTPSPAMTTKFEGVDEQVEPGRLTDERQDKPPILVPREYQDELAKLSKSALMDMSGTMPCRALSTPGRRYAPPGPRSEPGAERAEARGQIGWSSMSLYRSDPASESNGRRTPSQNRECLKTVNYRESLGSFLCDRSTTGRHDHRPGSKSYLRGHPKGPGAIDAGAPKPL